jgi:hypothetical protein
MEAINYLTDWIKWLLLIVPVGAACAVTAFAARKSMTDDEGVMADCDSNIRKTIKAAIIIMSISGLVTLFRGYYS